MISFFKGFKFTSVILIVLSFYFISCSTTGSNYNGQSGHETVENQSGNNFTVPGQFVKIEKVHSLQLHRTGNPGSAPVLELNSNQQLQLLFEILDFDSRQFRISFTHHNPDWSRSSLPPEFFMDGPYTLFLDAGQVSSAQRPDYRQFQFVFPDNRLHFTKSGNYLLRIEDQDSGELMLSLPFFVTENRGSTRSIVEEQGVPRQNLRITHRPISWYTIPEIVEQPIFDLEFYFIQNHFWGRSVQADEVDFSDPHEVKFEVGNRDRFIGDYEFLTLSLTNLSQSNPQIFESQPGQNPPVIYLSDDVSGFASSGGFVPGRFGRPNNNLDGQYANVIFTFDPGTDIRRDQQIYLVGDFNHWEIDSTYRLIYNESVNRWQTNAIIKEGTYNYKYIVLESGSVDDLYFDNLFSGTQQVYHAFIYMRDSKEFYYRLLHINQFISGS
ncbi:MAG: type IX secretion system plug protein domain-containing protein [Balneolaceae bacterium]